MTYLPRGQRAELDEHLRPLVEAIGDEPGKLSYVLYSLSLGFLGDAPTFASHAETIGTVECVKLELARRQLGKVHDSAIIMHGDVGRPR